ncbi:MAG: proton-conducting transporter membrane subunit [Anaerolineales bacterium]
MNAPAIFLITPGLVAFAAYVFFPRRSRLTIFLAVLYSLFLAFTASAIPLGAPWIILGHPLPVSNTLSFLGRSFTFNPEVRPIIMFLCLGTAALLAGSMAVTSNRILIPVLLLVLSLLFASLFIQPFLYASFFLFLSVVLLSLLLSDASHPSPRGAVRWISYSVFGTLFLLLAGSGISLYSNLPADPAKLEPILIQLCLGFGLLLAFPPFHFWLPEVSDDSPPYSVSLVLSLYVGGVIFILLRFLDGFSWLRQSSSVYLVFLLAGSGMCVIGSSLSLVQSRLGRCVGYLSLSNLGVVFLSLSIAGPIGVKGGLVLLALRGLSLLVWGVSFHTLRPKQASDHIADLRGRAFSNPVAFSAALLSGLSLVGVPGLFSFPAFWAVLRSVSDPGSSGSPAVFPQLAILFSMVAGIIALYRFARPMMQVPLAISISREGGRLFRALLLVSIISFFLLGIFPQILAPWVSRAASAFPNLIPQ